MSFHKVDCSSICTQMPCFESLGNLTPSSIISGLHLIDQRNSTCSFVINNVMCLPNSTRNGPLQTSDQNHQTFLTKTLKIHN